MFLSNLTEYMSPYSVLNVALTYNVSVVGDVSNVTNAVKVRFKHFKLKALPPKQRVSEPEQKFKKICNESKATTQSYVVLGYKTVQRSYKDRYVLDVIRGILGRGQSGRLFDELRNKRGLAYEVGCHHEPAVSYGMFATYMSTNKKNITECQKIILEILQDVKNV